MFIVTVGFLWFGWWLFCGVCCWLSCCCWCCDVLGLGLLFCGFVCWSCCFWCLSSVLQVDSVSWDCVNSVGMVGSLVVVDLLLL